MPISSPPAAVTPPVTQVQENPSISSAGHDVKGESADDERNILEGSKQMSLEDLFRDKSASPSPKRYFDSTRKVEEILSQTEGIGNNVRPSIFLPF